MRVLFCKLSNNLFRFEFNVEVIVVVFLTKQDLVEVSPTFLLSLAITQEVVEYSSFPILILAFLNDLPYGMIDLRLHRVD